MRKSFVIACAWLLCASTAGADVINDWNIRAAQSIGAGARRGPSGILDFAMVHGAIHDAVQAYEERFEPYCGEIPGASGSPIAAVAAAAHAVLVALFPSQAGALDTSYAESLAKYDLNATDPGAQIGRLAAQCILARLPADNLARAVPDTFVGGHLAGEWRPTTLTAGGAEVPMTAQFLATFEPFTLRHPAQFRARQDPPKLKSFAYARDYIEVKDYGALTDSKRSQEQTNVGLFFTDSPAAYWTGALRTLAETRLKKLGDRARLFALVYFAMADATITSWDSKIAFNFWRPITAIHNAQFDGNPRTEVDADWAPLKPTPNYPDYTSGANNNAGAATGMLANFFRGNRLDFSLTSTTIAAPDNVRTYTRLSDAAQDVVDARIYMGIHFRFADTAGLRQGNQVADWVFHRFLRPVSHRHHWDCKDHKNN